MKLSRRSFLTFGGAAAAAAFSACSAVSRRIAGDDLPQTIGLAGGADAAVARFLRRAGYGPRPGDLGGGASLAERVERQLNPGGIDDPAADLFVRNLNFYQRDVTNLLSLDYADQRRELSMAAIGRGVYSRRQLYEAMVEFWSDHFNIYLGKKKHMASLKIVDDRDVVRPHALGTFRDLLFASAHSPAMMLYLDNVASAKENPNENYARELMELHTLSVHGPYTQQDVREMARALTGWRVHERGRQDGRFRFDPEAHDFGAKMILGRVLPAGRGEQEMLDMLDLLAAHPATARFIATKLVRRFVADDPPSALVERVARIFESAGGDIKSMLRAIFLSGEFTQAPLRLRRPYSFMLAALRALHADIGLVGYRRLSEEWLPRLGQPVFGWPTPDGYPDTSEKWAASLLPRWNFALALVMGQIDGVRAPLDRLAKAGSVADAASAVEFFGGLLFNRSLTDRERRLFETYGGSGKFGGGELPQRVREMVALMIASPGFQWV